MKMFKVAALSAAAFATLGASAAMAYPGGRYHHPRPHKICKIERHHHHAVKVCRWVR